MFVFWFLHQLEYYDWNVCVLFSKSTGILWLECLCSGFYINWNTLTAMFVFWFLNQLEYSDWNVCVLVSTSTGILWLQCLCSGFYINWNTVTGILALIPVWFLHHNLESQPGITTLLFLPSCGLLTHLLTYSYTSSSTFSSTRSGIATQLSFYSIPFHEYNIKTIFSLHLSIHLLQFFFFFFCVPFLSFPFLSFFLEFAQNFSIVIHV